jgi:hypothetical protein
MARILTRQEFYDLVWSKPMTHLAKDFAISDVALHKICKRHGIPKPRPGWWLKKTAGKPISQPPLPPTGKGMSDRITIAAGVLGGEPTAVSAAREAARSAAAMGGSGRDVPSHPIVERTLARLCKARPSGLGTVKVEAAGHIKAEVAPDSVERLGMILNQIVAAATTQGFKLIATGSPARFSNDVDTIDISVSEIVDREKHVLTAAEEAKHAAWLVRRERAMKISPWRPLDYDEPKFPEWDYSLTGRLSFELEHVHTWGSNPLRRSFRDAKVQRLEDKIGDIAITIAVLAAAKVAERERREAEHQRWEEARRVRELEARAKHIAERRTAALRTILTELEELDRLKGQLALLERQAGNALSPRVGTFRAWAREQLATREARLSLASLEQRFETDQLFGETDDFGFRPSW